jgi:hypothetical protein
MASMKEIRVYPGIHRAYGDRVVVQFGPLFEGFFEPKCGVCGENIRWILDMQSFVRAVDGEFVMTHAWCAWTPGAFKRAKKKSMKFEKHRQKLPGQL